MRKAFISTSLLIALVMCSYARAIQDKNASAQNRIEEAIARFQREIEDYERRTEVDSAVVNAYTGKWRMMLKRADFEIEIPKIQSEIASLLARTANREINLRAAVMGYAILSDDEAQERYEQVYLSEFPKSGFAGQIFMRRIQNEKDAARKVALIEDYTASFPDRYVFEFFSTLFRYYAAKPDSPADKLVSASETWMKAHKRSAYERVEAAAVVATVLAERRIELDRAQAVIDETVRFAESLTAGAQALSDVPPSEQERLIAFLKDRALTAQGFVLLRRGNAEQAAPRLKAGLQRVIDEVEKRGVILWKDMDLRELGVRPRALWLAELYEAQKDYNRAARYLLAAYTDDERINNYIRERLAAVYSELKFDGDKATVDLKKAAQ